jgi:hypothetical protein
VFLREVTKIIRILGVSPGIRTELLPGIGIGFTVMMGTFRRTAERAHYACVLLLRFIARLTPVKEK